jgi:hypothetical protein
MFDEYLNKEPIHSDKLMNHVMSRELENVIFYGPQGVGKYSLALQYIRKYSDSKLKYSRKMTLVIDKKQYHIKISDIHYEVDTAWLSYNSKLLWHEMYQQIVESITTKKHKGIILCKNFQEINNELLDNFYNYMQHPEVIFILLTTELSFIPNTIVNNCDIINIPRPTKTSYGKISGKTFPKNISSDNITNIKDLTLEPSYIPICNQIINYMKDISKFEFIVFRNKIYNLLIYNQDIYSSMWYILCHFIKMGYFNDEKLKQIIIKTMNFLHLYNNNYHNIFHIENYLSYLLTQLHDN